MEEWLRAISDADIVVCDSFHGVVFSVIYHKEFFVLANPERGNSRINSILETLGLEDRLISSVAEIEKVSPIKWEKLTANFRFKKNIPYNSLQRFYATIDLSSYPLF